MPLNPAYDQQTTRTLPFCVGYVYAQGDKINSIAGFDGSTVEQYVLGYGEWDSCLYLSIMPTDHYIANWGLGPSVIKTPKFGANTPNQRYLDYHFHGGSYSPKGVPLNLISLGPDQGSDNWLQYFPSVTPPLCYSGMAYYYVRRIVTTVPMNPVGIYKTLRCRQFDEAGNVTGYGFTTNPTWQMIETLLRFQFKREQPSVAGLLASEKACFDWPAMVAHAQRNSFQLANGSPRFTGNFAFASNASLANMMETQLRNCRSFKRERGSVISFIGDDERSSVFVLSKRALVPGTLQIDKKDLSTAPNVYVPQFRDLGIPAVCEVASVVSVTSNQAGISTQQLTFNTIGQQPFFSQDMFTYSGSADDADYAGDYQVNNYTVANGTTSVTEVAPPNPDNFLASSADGYGPQTAGGTTGGYLGTQQSRFKQRAPTGVQHRSHQKSMGQVAPGITPLPRATQVQYDLGSNTFDQTNRLMKFLRDRDLGPDGPKWIAPLRGTLSGFTSAIDLNGAALAAVEDGDVITLDDTASPEFAGDFEVLGSKRTLTSKDSSAGQIELTIQSYYSSAPTDVSDPPGDTYQTLPNSLLPMADVLLVSYFWLMQATLTGVVTGSNILTFSFPDLSIWWVGDPAPTAYPGVTITNVPVGSHVILYLNVTNKATTPTLTLDTTDQYPSGPLPANQIVMFIGTVTALTGSGNTGTGVGTRPPGGPVGTPVGGRPGAHFQIPADPTSTLTAVVETSTGYYGPEPTSTDYATTAGTVTAPTVTTTPNPPTIGGPAAPVPGPHDISNPQG